jgi:hypothetical protein
MIESIQEHGYDLVVDQDQGRTHNYTPSKREVIEFAVESQLEYVKDEGRVDPGSFNRGDADEGEDDQD